MIALSLLGMGTTAATASALAGPHVRASAASANTQFMLFNLSPAGSYDVQRNSVAAGSAVAGPSGVLVFESNVSSGDRITFLLSGTSPVSPTRPGGFTATGGSSGCVAIAWNPPAASEYVTDYSLLWGKTAGVYTDSTAILASDIAKGTAWAASQCGFASGTYALALRAHNAFDRWSPLSATASATIGNQNTQGPVPPTNVKVTESSFGCANITWARSSDASVSGYRVYFGTHPRTQSAYSDSIDAGNAVSAGSCGLAAGTYYFSVRAYTGAGVMSAFSREVTLTAQGMDTAPPSISQRAPAAGATGVPLNASIYFVTADDKTGVDPASIVVKLDGIAQSFTTAAAPGGLAVQCDPAGDFAPDADVEVQLSVADRATPPNVATRLYTFHTGTAAITDTDPPVLSATSPVAGATNVDPRPAIEVLVSDAGLGVDLSSVAMEVNGQAVAFTITGDPASARLRYRASTSFAAGAVVHVHVTACDRAQPPHCAPALDYSFTVLANAALAGAGAIVPDGFWVNDPARPLEIHDLPQSWTVRIFDTAGAVVRRHENAAEGSTWTWDFRNDDGRRVAPALYFVRVTDTGGSVRRSGRFLVQSQQ